MKKEKGGLGFVTFRPNKCKGCELCASVCPKKIIRIHEMTVNEMGYRTAYAEDASGTACIACANCALMCPDGAIIITRSNRC